MYPRQNFTPDPTLLQNPLNQQRSFNLNQPPQQQQTNASLLAQQLQAVSLNPSQQQQLQQLQQQQQQQQQLQQQKQLHSNTPSQSQIPLPEPSTGNSTPGVVNISTVDTSTNSTASLRSKQRTSVVGIR
ncbi:unnamed protein product [Ambrosiozyma monospora]|uniref:Unnamed protein product n=1 Tax=Ambrosiozyma monospora TaxID=43982 RepID=A0ACB5TSL3_AMBMO|nr:unnamed protein product [Ambrosiozyma monospora]